MPPAQHCQGRGLHGVPTAASSPGSRSWARAWATAATRSAPAVPCRRPCLLTARASKRGPGRGQAWVHSGRRQRPGKRRGGGGGIANQRARAGGGGSRGGGVLLDGDLPVRARCSSNCCQHLGAAHRAGGRARNVHGKQGGRCCPCQLARACRTVAPRPGRVCVPGAGQRRARRTRERGLGTREHDMTAAPRRDAGRTGGWCLPGLWVGV